MAKRASNKPAAKAAATKTAAVSTALPTSNESAQPGAEQGMAAPISPQALDTPLVETPPGVSGVSSPVAPLSDDDDGENTPEIIVGSESMGAADEPPGEVLTVPVDHPAVVLAQSFVTPHGKPEAVHGNYYTPPPPELRKPAKASR